MFKQCGKCKRWKIFSEFSKGNGKFNRRSECKECQREYNKIYQKEHSDVINAQNRERWHNGRNEKLAYYKEYREKNAEKIREQRYQRDLRYKASQGEKLLERVSKQSAEWRKANPDKACQQGKNRRARVAGAVGRITSEELQKLKEQQNFKCLACGRREPDIELTHDHIKPISKGGENTIQNSQMLCRSCNSRKGTKHIDYRTREAR